MQQIAGSACSVKCLDKIPAPSDLQSQHLVVEVFSDEKLKLEALRTIARFDHWNGPVASLLYRGSATEWAARSGLGEKMVGFYACPSLEDIRSAELLAGETTQSEALKQVETFFADLGFSIIICKDRDRILNVWYNEGMRALDEGLADAAHIDQTIRDGGGFRMGPLELRDLVGLDVGLQVTSSL
jgi:3-hydroxybutyryl-CoA dehydrogenase